MNTRHHTFFRPSSLLLAIGAALLCASALAADKGNASDAQARYQQERAACLNGQSNEDRATCLREAGAALNEARKGQLDKAGADYARNELARCQALHGSERDACVARMEGRGTTSGSVLSGGIYRELVTVEPAAPDAASK